jgi:hypothetical protein
MENLLNNFLQNHSLDEIVAGAPLDFDKVPEENIESVVTILLHCCINGPFSPNKSTNYPIIGEERLNDLVGDQKVSNNGLKKTCDLLVPWLQEQNYEHGYMFNIYGNYWPRNDFQPPE